MFDLENSRGLPYDLREVIALEKSSFFALETDWSISGAQEFPFGMVVAEKYIIQSALNETSVVYIGGPMDEQLVLFRTGL